jgi:sugar lactone lactonase YvrE
MKNDILRITGICLALTGAGLAQKVIPNHAVANLVLGQTDFVTGTTGSPDSSFSLQIAGTVIVDPVTGKVFVSDRGNNRVLRYPSASSLQNGAGAEAVFGQSNFNSSSAAATREGMAAPRSVFLDRRGRLWVGDGGNNRVLMFEAAVFRQGPVSADRVFGQPDFTTVSSGTTASKMSTPIGVVVDSADRLWVCENGNDRVLRFDSISTKASGTNADGVLGQADFVSGASGSGASRFSNPAYIAVSSSGTLFVGDTSNNRVLRFANAASLADGAPATGVLGQLDFTTNTSGLSSTKMNGSAGVWITPDDTLWVTDNNNDRHLRFRNASTIASGSPADGVVGQASFTADATATTNRGINLAGTFNNPFVDGGGNLWVADPGNNRVLRFPPDTTLPLLTVTPVPPKTTTKKSIQIKGTASDFYGISKVIYRVNGGVAKNASGTTSWQFTTSLKKGPNTILINAVDAVGNLSATRTIKIKRK